MKPLSLRVLGVGRLLDVRLNLSGQPTQPPPKWPDAVKNYPRSWASAIHAPILITTVALARCKKPRANRELFEQFSTHREAVETAHGWPRTPHAAPG